MTLRKELVFLALILLSSQASAISANSAVNYISSQNHFLYEEEKYEQPNVKVKYGEALYWVIPVTMNDELTTLFAVRESDGELSKDKGANRQLFRTATLLRNYTLTKSDISGKKGIPWLVTKEYARIFETLATSLQDETSDLTIIKTTINKSEVSQKTSEMTSKLVQMSILCNSTAKSIDDALLFEADYSTQPDTSRYDSLRGSMNEVFLSISKLDEIAVEYRQDISELKQIISVQESLEAQDKDFLIKKAELPEDFAKIGGYATTSLQLQSALDALYSNIQKNVDSYLNEFDERVKRDEAYTLLYEENKSLKSKTGGYLVNLKAARDYIVDADRVDGWTDAESVSKLSGYWDNAKNYFDKRDYEKAKDYADRAIKEAIIVYEGGLKEEESNPLFSNDTIIKAIIALFVLLLALFLWNNRSRIFSFANNGKDGDGKKDLEF